MPTSLDVYQPFDAGAGANVTEDQWRQMARHWLLPGVLRGEDNGFEVFGDDSGMQVKVRTGKCWIRGHYGESTGEKALAVSAAHATNPRIDRAVMRLDPVDNVLELDVLTGTPAGSPSAPALTQSGSGIWEVSLGRISVPATDTSIGAAQVTDERSYCRPAHGGDQIGDVKATARSTAPGGWLLCFGQAVSRFTYWELFAELGTTYGAGDGSTTFGLPDLRGRVPVGLDNMGGSDAGRLSVANTLGGTGGAQTHTLTDSEIPSHAHGNAEADHDFIEQDLSSSTWGLSFGVDLGASPAGFTGAAGGGGAHNNMQPYLLTNWIIKAN